MYHLQDDKIFLKRLRCTANANPARIGDWLMQYVLLSFYFSQRDDFDFDKEEQF